MLLVLRLRLGYLGFKPYHSQAQTRVLSLKQYASGHQSSYSQAAFLKQKGHHADQLHISGSKTSARMQARELPYLSLKRCCLSLRMRLFGS
jgi:hypothetical protein